MKGKQTESRSSSGLHECIQMTMAGLTSFETKPCLQGPSLIPVSNRKLPWVQMRHGTGSNTRNQNEISVPDFGSQTFPFLSVSPIKSQNRSELRKAFSSQNTIKKASQPLWRGQGEVLDGADWLHCPQTSTWVPWSSVEPRKRVPSELPLAGRLTRLKTTLKRSAVFFGSRKQKSGSLEIRAAGNENIPFYFTFFTLLNYKELES